MGWSADVEEVVEQNRRAAARWLPLDARAAGPPGILVDDTHAVMTRAQFDALMTYSSTVPTGVIPGKRWKSLGDRWNGRCAGDDYLAEYVLSEREGMCHIVWRRILLVD